MRTARRYRPLAVLVDELEDFAGILLGGQRFDDGVGNATRDPRVETVKHDRLQVRNDLTKVSSGLPLIKIRLTIDDRLVELGY
jgi:hypothetical protein